MYGSIVTLPRTEIPSLQTSATGAQREVRLRRMVAVHFDMVWRALKRLGVPAEAVDDACQRVWLAAARKLDTIEPERERAYLLGIALRVASDARRAARRRHEVADGGDAERSGAGSDLVPTPDALLDEKRARENLSRVLDRLPPDLREAFVLFELEELTAAAVAVVLDVPEGTVASRVRRAREQVRASLERIVRKAG